LNIYQVLAICGMLSPIVYTMMWIVQIAEETDFEEKWINAKDIGELRDIILSSWRKRKVL